MEPPSGVHRRAKRGNQEQRQLRLKSSHPDQICVYFCTQINTPQKRLRLEEDRRSSHSRLASRRPSQSKGKRFFYVVVVVVGIGTESTVHHGREAAIPRGRAAPSQIFSALTTGYISAHESTWLRKPLFMWNHIGTPDTLFYISKPL